MAEVMILKMKENSNPRPTAAEDMRRQFEESCEFTGHYNASRMWREVGRPRGHDPIAWLAKAEPLVVGVRGYFANLESLPEAHDFDAEEIVFESVIAEELLGMEIGDRFMTFLLALAYSRYLDSKPERAVEAS